MNTKNLWIAALIGAVVTTFFANFPVINLINCLVCLRFWGGPLLAVWFYKRQSGTMTMNQAIYVGLPSAVLMLAHRDIERAADVVAMIQAAGMTAQRKSRLDRAVTGPRVIVLDTRGELARAYCEAAVAFFGGTLIPVGGHVIYWSRRCGASRCSSAPIRTIVQSLPQCCWRRVEECGCRMRTILPNASSNG